MREADRRACPMSDCVLNRALRIGKKEENAIHTMVDIGKYRCVRDWSGPRYTCSNHQAKSFKAGNTRVQNAPMVPAFH